MKLKQIAKIAVDIAMTIAILLLMTYELIGQATHEWLGIGMFVLFVVHHILNGNWSMMMGMAGKFVKKPSKVCRWILRGLAVLIAGYGLYAFLKRDIGSYMLLQNQFVFFDFEEPLPLFLLDYLASMGLFVAVGHYLSTVLKKTRKRKSVV